MSKNQPYMKFYVNDYLSSPTVACMTLAQQGAYIRLLCFCWSSGNASLPDDDRQLASLAGAGEGYLELGWSLVRDCFVDHPTLPGKLTHPKIYELQQEMEIQAEKSRLGGKKSAQIRARKAAQETSKVKSKGASNLVPTKSQPNFKQSESESESETKSDIEIPPTPSLPASVVPQPTPDSARTFPEFFDEVRPLSMPIDPEIDWLTVEHEFMARWNKTAGVAIRGRPVVPGNLMREFKLRWSDPEWRANAMKALGKFPLRNGVTISLRKFLEESTVDDILGGVHDFSSDRKHEPGRSFGTDKPVSAFERRMQANRAKGAS